MLSSASTTVNKQVWEVSPTGWYGNFSDSVVWRVICWTQSRQALLAVSNVFVSLCACSEYISADLRDTQMTVHF